MRHIGILLWVLAGMVAYAPFAAADLESVPLQPPTHSLAEQQPPEDRIYIPSWADPYGQLPDLGINDDPTLFDPGDVDTGRSPFDSDDF
jgi:hypothetical protein